MTIKIAFATYRMQRVRIGKNRYVNLLPEDWKWVAFLMYKQQNYTALEKRNKSTE